MKTTANVVLIMAAFVSIAATTAAADGALAFVGVYPDETIATCQHSGGASTVSVAYVILTNSIPLQEISFSAPIPDCLGGSGAFVFETSTFATTGNSQTGITIDLGECTTSPVTLLTIYYSGASAECCPWVVLPHGGAPWPMEFEFIDCDGGVRPGASAVNGPLYTGECCRTFDVLAPYEPYPADGATGVSTEVDLEWLLPDLRCGEWIYFDVIPAPWEIVPNDDFDYYTTYDPGTLQPNTTYYWKVYMQCDMDTGARSPLWSFTTGDGPVAVESSTWGRVKALYEP